MRAALKLHGDIAGEALSAEGTADFACDPGAIEVSHCVNCTGVGFDVTQDRRPLMKQLLRDRIVEEHPFGGVWVNPDTFSVVSGDRAETDDNSAHRQPPVGHRALGHNM